MNRARTILIWGILVVATLVPITLAATSPLLAWREPIYIMAGFSGIIALVLMLIQPLLARGYLPGFPALYGRRIHRWVGVMLVAAVVIHVVALWITSPPDVVDALLFASPTPFSAWGVIAMWAIFIAALLAFFRRRLHLRPRHWRLLHTSLAAMAILGTILHALLIEGTMEPISKVVLCGFVLLVTLKVMIDLRVWIIRPSRTL